MGIDFNDRDNYKDMVKWFSPRVLLESAKQCIISTLFGSQADRRLIHAALDELKTSNHEIDLTHGVKIDENGELWFDYVADTGDGFDSTYAIAYLLAQKELTVDDKILPRGSVLIMGGDEVYPTPSRDEYKYRLENPYSYAFPDSNSNATPHPYVFLIPGNHDWYDGLRLFLARFCQGRSFGNSSWRTIQTRSYFAIKLPANWWIWGIDTQLGEDIDSPQHDYFCRISKQISLEKANIVICAAVPSWTMVDSLDSKEREYFKRGIDHVATKIIKENCAQAKIYAVLSGDSHHYSRYTAEKTETEFVTAGGGGAFLHPTHQLKDKINNVEWCETTQDITLSKKSTEDNCFPNRKTSKKLAFGDLKFPFLNRLFCCLMGAVYAFLAFVLVMWRQTSYESTFSPEYISWFANNFYGVVSSPIFWVILIVLLFIFHIYADNHFQKTTRWIFGIIHAIAHLLCIVFLLSIAPVLISGLLDLLCIEHIIIDWEPYSWSLLFLLAIVFGLGKLASGFIWGVYLLIASLSGHHSNDAFSAMRIADYKNFLRICIKDDTLTIYPIGLEKVPTRKGWEINKNKAENGQANSKIVPKSPLKPVFIEKPFCIKRKT
jgi:hypothetical protein